MATFRYEARDANGKRRRGIEEGESPRQVRELLRQRGLVPLTVTEGGGQRGWLGWLRWRRPRADNTRLAMATRQLGALLGSGLPLERALTVTAEQSAGTPLRGILTRVRHQLLEGRSLAAALGGFPEQFPPTYLASVAAGEESGRLAAVLEVLADHLESAQQLHQRLTLAMLYPLIVLLLSLTVAGGLVVYIVPQLVEIFRDMGRELPWLTRGLLAVSGFLRGHGVALAVGLAATAAALGWLGRRPRVRLAWHRVALSLPVASPLLRGVEGARLANTLGLLLVSGTPLVPALELAAGVVGNLALRGVVREAARQVQAGGSLHQGLARGGLFPPLLVHLVASGEESGNLPAMLQQAARAQEREAEMLVAVLAGVLEPLLIVFMGGVVITVVLAILMPLFELNQMIG